MVTRLPVAVVLNTIELVVWDQVVELVSCIREVTVIAIERALVLVQVKAEAQLFDKRLITGLHIAFSFLSSSVVTTDEPGRHSSGEEEYT